MLQLKHKNGEYELTDRTVSVRLRDRSVTLGDQTIQEPGEYEVSNVEIVYGDQAALIIWEHLQIAYVFSAGTPGTFEKNQFSSSDVLIIGDNIDDVSKPSFDALLASYDPKIVVVSPEAKLEAGLKGSLKLQDNPAIKLAVANLPEEEREFYLAV